MTDPTPSLALIFGPMEMLLVVVVLILLFGARKIPQLAKGLGAGIRNFKGELKPPSDSDDGPDASD